MDKEQRERRVYTESTALMTALDWSGLDSTGPGLHKIGVGLGGGGAGSGGGAGKGRIIVDAAVVKATQTACRYSHVKHRHHHIAFKSFA